MFFDTNLGVASISITNYKSMITITICHSLGQKEMKIGQFCYQYKPLNKLGDKDWYACQVLYKHEHFP